MNPQELTIQRNPYPGLRAFESHEADLFFGRDEQVFDVLERLRSSRFLAVSGLSGCGKSSLIRAGVCLRWKEVFFRRADQSSARRYYGPARILSTTWLIPCNESRQNRVSRVCGRRCGAVRSDSSMLCGRCGLTPLWSSSWINLRSCFACAQNWLRLMKRRSLYDF